MPGSTLTRTMNGIIEGCWLLAVIMTPLFFDVLSRRVFEPDKIVVLRNLVIIMAIAFIVKGIDVVPRLLAKRANSGAATTEESSSTNENSFRRGARRLWQAYPLLFPIAIFFIIYIAATIHSIDPGISFWGSYERLQGTYTWLTYLALFLFMITHIHRWEQIERIITAAIITSIPVSLYGIIQHFRIDFLQWGGDVFSRVASTMGNSIFLGAYLLMVVPLTIYRIYSQAADLMQPPVAAALVNGRGGRRATPAAIPAWQRRRTQRNGVIMLAIYTMALLMELFATLYTYSRGPFGGLVVALILFGLLAGLRYKIRWLSGSTIGLLVLGVLILALANKPNPLIHSSSNGIMRLVAVTSSESGTSEVRTLIWQGSFKLIKAHPLLGIGPETMLLAYNAVYPSALGHIESANASPDRNHDEEMDFLVMSGIPGLVAYLAMLGVFFWMAFKLVRRLPGTRESLLVIAVISMVAGHIGEGLVGIAIVSTLTMLWVGFAIVSLIYQRASSWSLMGATAAVEEIKVASVAVPVAIGAATGGATSRASRPSTSRSTSNGKAAPSKAVPSRQVSTPKPEPLSGGRSFAALGSLVVGFAAIVGLLVLFYSNYLVVHADVVFKDAMNYEQAANNYVSAAEQAQQSASTTGNTQPASNASQVQQDFAYTFAYFNAAINSYQEAISEQPSQDFYYLYMGKTLLEKVQADRADNNTAARNSDVLQAESILLRAHAISPLDTDHSANLGRLYSMWATWDPSKWTKSLQWFDHAIHLSPHSSDLLDEYGTTVRSYGQYLASINQSAQAHAMYIKARNLFEQAFHVDPKQTNALTLWGDTEFVPTFLNDEAAAIYPYEKVLTMLPPTSANVPALYNNLGIAYLQQKNYTKAQQNASKAMSAAAALLKGMTSNQSSYQQLAQTYNQALSIYNQATTNLKKKK